MLILSKSKPKKNELNKPIYHGLSSYDPIVTESKGMLKTPEFDASYDPVVTESKCMQKKIQNLTHQMTL